MIFPKHNILLNKHTYKIINASYEIICVEFDNKTTLLISSNCPKLLQYATTDHLNIIFDEFDI